MRSSNRFVRYYLYFTVCITLATGCAPDSSAELSPAGDALQRSIERFSILARRTDDAPTPIQAKHQDGRFVADRGGTQLGSVSIGEHVTRGFELVDATSDVAISVTPLGLIDVPGEAEGEYVVFRGAVPGGGDWIHRLSDDGTEDYAVFEAVPERTELRYEIILDKGSRGLRLIENEIEVLDEKGAPRLRMTAPLAQDAEGKLASLDIDVEGCAIDRDPAPPWDRPVVSPGANRCHVRIRFDDANLSYPVLVDPQWSSAGNAGSRYGHTLTRLSNGRVLLVGGRSAGDAPTLNGARLYDPATNSWALTGSLAVSRMSHAATLLQSGHVLISGGDHIPDPNDAWTTVTSAELYNPTNGTWSTTGSLTTARTHHTLITLNDGRAAAFGGGLALYADIYNPATGTFTKSTALSGSNNQLVARGRASATLLSDGRVLLVGGHSTTSNQSEIFNPSNHQFSTGRSTIVPRLRYHGSARLPDGKVVLVGGSTRAEVYDPTTHTWSSVGAIRKEDGVDNASVFALPNGTIAAVVNTGPYPHLPQVYIYRHEHGIWSESEVAAVGPSDVRAVALADGRILVTGLNFSSSNNTSAIYDPSTPPITVADYAYPPSGGPVPNQLEGRVYRPTTLAPAQQYPLVFVLHGRHHTCRNNTTGLDDNDDFRLLGTCPTTHSVIQSHRGFGYLGEELARRGFIVISVHAARGVYEVSEYVGLLNQTYSRVNEWNSGVVATPSSLGVDLTNRIDFDHVGFVGHSLGARAAWNVAQNVGAEGIFEIEPADPESGALGGVVGIPWVALVGACDEEVGYSAAGSIFDQTLWPNLVGETTSKPKGVYTVWGVNHRFYNTEWRASVGNPYSGGLRACYRHDPVYTDSYTTIGNGSAAQRQTLIDSVIPFLLAHVSPTPNPLLNRLFDPAFSDHLPEYPPVTRAYSRGVAANDRRILHFFDATAGLTQTKNGATSFTVNWVPGHQTFPLPHQQYLRAAKVDWTSASTSNWFQAGFPAQNITSFDRLELRVDRAESSLNLQNGSSTQLQVQLVSGSTLSSKVALANYVSLRGPVGTSVLAQPTNPILLQHTLQTARIPLSAFTGVNLASITGVRFTFQNTTSGSIYITGIQASKN